MDQLLILFVKYRYLGHEFYLSEGGRTLILIKFFLKIFNGTIKKDAINFLLLLSFLVHFHSTSEPCLILMSSKIYSRF